MSGVTKASPSSVKSASGAGRFARAAAWLILAAVASWMTWNAPLRLFEAQLPLPGLIASAATHAVVTLALASGLADVIPHRWDARRYRLAFALSAGQGIVPALQLPPLWGAMLIIAATVGAFGGGLWATWRRTGLWEDNYPPGADLAARIVDLHRKRLQGPTPANAGKRAFDILLGGVGGLVALPLAGLICLAVWLEDPGPLFFVKNSVGRGGRNFRQWKIRTMVRSAEEETGPILARESDERVLRSGRVLRQTALDELPQLLNILQGSMSFVGPRPQRTVLVEQYLLQMPEYADRHRVAPGLAGLAQVAGDYYLTPRQKLRYDRLYVDHAGLGFDLKLIAIAFAIVFWLRWNPRWNGRIPRAWIRWPAKSRAS
ncbi:MAG TPA: sugar transferase [Anaerolineales bacterium]|nr:sugar transferase [Anaerolineales bacterium]